jgi:AraC family transcriptional regulator
MEGLALEIVAEASRHGVRVTGRTPPRWQLRACSLLHDRFAENLSLTDIAAEVDIHPVHLSREFHRQYGCILGEYVRRLRVEFSRQTLASSDVPLIEIALAAGFSDQSHLTKVFRRQMKMTPGEYRRRFRSRQADPTGCFLETRSR